MPKSSDPLMQRLHQLRVERDDWRRIAQNRANEIVRLREQLQAFGRAEAPQLCAALENATSG